MLGDDLLSGVFAATAAGAHRELALHFEQRTGTPIDGLANLAITYSVADAHIHVGRPLISGPKMARLRTNSNRE